MKAMDHRRAFTLIEVLVVVAVIGLLVALLLPAAQAAREAARRAQCSHQLKEIGLALGNHLAARNVYPRGLELHPFNSSYLIPLLPYLEQGNLFNSINTSMTYMEPDLNANQTVSQSPLGSFLCPTDAARSTPEARHSINYAANCGSASLRGTGVFTDHPISDRDITDGLSQTVGVAEWVVGPGERQSPTRLGSSYRLSGLYTDAPSDVAAFHAACRALEPGKIQQTYGRKGQFWLEGRLGFTLFNNSLPPNNPSCVANNGMNANTAGSLHSGGCQVLMMDGSVHFIKESIEARVWTAMGTRAGSDLVTSDQF